MSQDVAKPKHRELREGFHWTQECLHLGELKGLDAFDMSQWVDPGNGVHACQNAYLLQDEQSLLFDTLTQPNGDDVVDLVDSILDGESLDYLAISHPEANHAGNTFTLLEAYPEATLLVPEHAAGRGSGHEAEHELYHIARDARSRDSDQVPNPIEYISDGDRIDLGEYTVEFHEPVVADHAFTVWMSETTTNTLFTVDWMGFQHQDADCISLASEFEHDLALEQVFRFHALAFPWLQFADPERIDACVAEVRERFDPDILAPAHGAVITEDPDEYLDLFRQAARRLAENGDPENMRSKLEYILPSKAEVGR